MDYLWNAWHFAAQHHGVYRICRRRPASVLAAFLEKWLMRGFLLYVVLRVIAVTGVETAWDPLWRTLDNLVLLIPAGLLLRELSGRPRLSSGTLYLVSVSCLYIALLWAIHRRRLSLVLALTTASALFHAVEYLGLVSWSVGQRYARLGRRMGTLGYLAPRWASRSGSSSSSWGLGAGCSTSGAWRPGLP